MDRKRRKRQERINTGVSNRVDDGKQPRYYDQQVVDYIRYVYIVAIIVWIIIILFLRIEHQPSIVAFIVLIPLALFLIAYSNAEDLTVESEKEFFQADCFTIGLVLVLPLFTWLNRTHCGNRNQFSTVLLLSIGLGLTAVLDAWVPIRWVAVTRHIRSALQVMAVILLVYCLYMYYGNINTSTITW